MRWVSTLLAAVFLAAPVLVVPQVDSAQAEVKLQVTIDKAKVDLEARRLEVKMNRTASHVTVKVFSESGKLLAEEKHEFAGKPPGTPLVVTWSPSGRDAVARIDVYGYDDQGYYSGIRIVPWSLSIPHEEVNFETNQAAILASEEPKLQESLGKITEAIKEHGDLGQITLFIAGHTDTVGTPEHNMDLSRRRARSIAAWFGRHGLRIPIAYEGFGETSPLVKTADEVDEQKNRRVDYVLSIEEPRFKSTGRAPSWKRL